MPFFKTSGHWLGLLGLMVLGALLLAGAQSAGVATITAPAVSAHAHATATAVFQISVEPGYHIQSNHPKLDYLIPSAITITPAAGIAATKVAWPPTVDQKFSFSPQPLAVFAGHIQVPVTLTTGAAGEHVLHGSFRYQACNDQLCRPPVTQPFTLDVRVR